jgi:tetratricopeptide (TPR) repeat protein
MIHPNLPIEPVEHGTEVRPAQLLKNRYSWLYDIAFGVLISALAFILYQNTLDNKYSFDDYYVMDQNPKVIKGIAGIPDIFTSRYHEEEGCVFGYRPVIQSVFALEYEYWGADPRTSHLINLIFYILDLILAYIILRKLFNKYHPILPFVTVLLFAAHPIHTEAVANVKNRDILLGFLLSLGSLFLFMKYFETRRWWWIPLAVLCFIIAMYSKEETVTFAIIIPISLFFYRPVPTPRFRDFRFRWPIFLLPVPRLPSFPKIRLKRFDLIRTTYIILIIICAGGSLAAFILSGSLAYPGVGLYYLTIILLIIYYRKWNSYKKNGFRSFILNPVIILGLIAYALSIVFKTYIPAFGALLCFAIYFLGISFSSINSRFKRERIRPESKVPAPKKIKDPETGNRRFWLSVSWELRALILISIFLPLLGWACYKLPNLYLPVEYLRFYRAENPLFAADPAFDRFTLGLSSLYFYLEKLAWPEHFGFYYGYNMIPAAEWDGFKVLFSLIFHTTLLILAVAFIRKRHILSFAVLFYIAAVSIFMNLVIPIPGIVAERFVFSAALSFCMIVAFILFWGIGMIRKKDGLTWWKQALIVALVIALIVPYSQKTIERNKDWKDYNTIFTRDIKYLDNSVKAHYTLVNWLSRDLFNDYQHGIRGGPLIQKANDILTRLNRIIEIDSTFHFAWNNMGVLYSDILNQNKLAISCFSMAIEHDTTYAEGFYNLGTALFREGNVAGGAICYEKAILFKSSYIRNIAEMANDYFSQGQFREPLIMYPIILKKDSTLLKPTLNLGFCYLLNQDTARAIPLLEKAFIMDPTFYELGIDLYYYFGQHGNMKKAEEYKVMAYLNRKK